MSESLILPSPFPPDKPTETSTTPATPASMAVTGESPQSRRCPRPGLSVSSPKSRTPTFPSSLTPLVSGPRRFGVRCTTSARGMTRTVAAG